MKRRKTVDKRSYKRSVKRRYRYRMLYLMLPCICVLLIAFSSFADAHNTREKYYTSVMVESGDTLWTLADKYGSVEYRDYNAYINEVKEMNHISSDDIHAGSYLVLPYYE